MEMQRELRNHNIVHSIFALESTGCSFNLNRWLLHASQTVNKLNMYPHFGATIFLDRLSKIN